MQFKSAFLAAIFALGLGPAVAGDVSVGSLQITAPWVRATPKGSSVGGGYMKITNKGTASDRLIAGSSLAAAKVEIHNMTMEGGVMKMRPLADGLEIKPGATVELKPGGYHVMLMGLKQPFKKGEMVRATLQFEKAGKVDVDFMVEGLGATKPSEHKMR